MSVSTARSASNSRREQTGEADLFIQDWPYSGLVYFKTRHSGLIRAVAVIEAMLLHEFAGFLAVWWANYRTI